MNTILFFKKYIPKNVKPKLMEINFIKNIYYIFKVQSFTNGTKKIDNNYKNKVQKFWKKYSRFAYKWHNIYTNSNNVESVKYIPENVFYTLIEPKLNRADLVLAYKDKNKYNVHFPNSKQPQTIIKNINGFFIDSNGKTLTKCSVLKRIENNSVEMIIKPSIDSGGGNDIDFISDNHSNIDELLNRYKKDYIIQNVLEQSEEISEFYPHSLNTIRIMTFRDKNNYVKVLSSVIRFGNSGNKVDNQNSGGVAVGINNKGVLNNFATDKYGKVYNSHPFTKKEFNNFKVPNFEKVLEMAQTLHKGIEYYRLISWDIAIDKFNEPVLIEANLRNQGINLHQYNNGAIFENIFEEIFDVVEH